MQIVRMLGQNEAVSWKLLESIGFCHLFSASCLFNGSARVDLDTHDGDGLLVDASRVPFLDHFEIRLALLISATGFPPFLAQIVRGRGQRIGLGIEIDPPVAVGIHAIAEATCIRVSVDTNSSVVMANSFGSIDSIASSTDPACSPLTLESSTTLTYVTWPLRSVSD